MIPLFDLHCDTLSEMCKHNESFFDNNLHISINNAKQFSPYFQVCAIWSDSSLSDEDAYLNYIETVSFAKKQISFITNCNEIKEKSFILAVEDARILNDNLSRLEKLYQDGVRILTLNWKGKSIIGGGWDTNFALTDFGKNVLIKCFELGIIPDISHSSVECCEEIFNLSKLYNKPVIASHSNSFSICNHKRNLCNEHFNILVQSNSILGISLASEHITNKKFAQIKDLMNHIYHFLSLGGENTICLGCDFDGVTSLPHEINSIKDLSKLYKEIDLSFGQRIANKIFFYNAFEFMSKNLK